MGLLIFLTSHFMVINIFIHKSRLRKSKSINIISRKMIMNHDHHIYDRHHHHRGHHHDHDPPGKHEKKVVGEDLRSSPCILQETLGGDKNIWFCEKYIWFPYQNQFEHLVDDNSIASAVRNLTHATIGHPSKLKEEFGNINFQQQKNFILNLMTSCSCLTVLTELVEQQKDNCVAVLVIILMMMTIMMMAIMTSWWQLWW